MAEIRYEHPLKLPVGWAATPPSARVFNTAFPRTLTLTEALRLLGEEIQRFPFTAATIYSAYQHLTNERLRQRIGNDTGASVMLKCFGHEHFLACDHWQLIEHNIYALHLTLRAVSNFEEWGVATRSYALSLFSGNITTRETMADAAASADTSGLPAWMLDLGLGPSATLDDANAIYRRRAKELVADEAGLLRLNQLIEQARRHLS